MKYLCFFLVVFYVNTFQISAQVPAEEKDTVNSENFSIYPFPFILFSPETELGFGGVTLFSFRFNGESPQSRNSQFQLGITYTLLNQLIFFVPFQLYYKDEKYFSFGQLGYNRFSYFFYGIGSDAKEEDEELYDVNFPKVNINVLQELRPSWYFGVRYKMEFHDIKSTEEEGMLRNANIQGSDGGVISSLGVITIFDNRDNYNFPSRGHFFTASFLPNLKLYGSDFNFSRLSVDYMKYFKFKEHYFAFNLLGISLIGDAPFNELAFIGGRDKMRGYYEGRFRDNNLLMAQGEYRKFVYKNWGIVLFGAFGAVAEDYSDFTYKDIKPSGGFGFRYQFNQEEKLNIRMDVGFGEKGNSGLYLTLGEAF